MQLAELSKVTCRFAEKNCRKCRTKTCGFVETISQIRTYGFVENALFIWLPHDCRKLPDLSKLSRICRKSARLYPYLSKRS